MIIAFVALGLAACTGGVPMQKSSIAEDAVLRASRDFTAAVATNDTGAIERATAEDWHIIDGDGHIISRAAFLKIVASGMLKHSALSISDEKMRVYGNAAIVTGHAKSVGTYAGKVFSTDEFSTDFWIRTKEGWKCVLTQLTTLKP
jgi:ketosteroid isomerase-like protein